ncbi:conserved protein of unknown function [Tenacibaculum sp. 190524A02b]|uniref:carboxypeptidase-like regulatory domain-containing protein n=1 Tax=Tenacibaculum vairaonense TaxID=3137860 RepID=UPI0032B20818
MNNQINSFLIKGLVFIIWVSNSFSQELFISGVIMDKEQLTIPYVNIIALNKNEGTFSDEKGNFKLLRSDFKDSDIIEFSCLGYKTKQITVKDLKNEKIKIYLVKVFEKLDEVVLKVKKMKTYTKGKTRTNTSDMIRFSSSFKKYMWNKPGHEIGRKFSLGTKKSSYLKKFNFYIKENTFKNSILKINIYNVKDNKPYKYINKSNIIVTLDNEFVGWKTVDLSNLDIVVKEDIIITVEYLKSVPSCYKQPGNCGLFFPYIYPTFFTDPMYTKKGIKEEWEIRKGETISMTLTYKK